MRERPLDVLHLIMSKIQEIEDRSPSGQYRQGQCTMGALATCSRELRSIAQPLLFEIVYINGIRRAEQLQDLLRTNPSLISRTKTLVIHHDQRSQSTYHLDTFLEQLTVPASLQPGCLDLFACFRNLLCVHIWRMHIRDTLSAEVQKALRFHSVERVIIDQCTISDYAALWDFTALFPASVHLKLHFAHRLGSNARNKKSKTIPPVPLSELRYLHIQPVHIPYLEMGWLCEFLARSGRLRSLYTLSLQISRKPASLVTLHTLLQHTVNTLAMLVLAWKVEYVSTPDRNTPAIIPELGPLPHLRQVSFRELVPESSTSFQTAATLFADIAKAAHGLSQVVIDMDVSRWRHTIAQDIWVAIEAANVRPHYAVTIKYNTCLRWGPGEWFTESDVREVLPHTVRRGGLDLELRQYYEDDDVECMVDTDSPFA